MQSYCVAWASHLRSGIKQTGVTTTKRRRKKMDNGFFAALIMGHLLGDYMFQNKWMAMNKAGNSFTCAVHCLIYTVCVASATWPFFPRWEWPILIFLTHFPIDRWNLADKWLALINGRSLKDFFENGHRGLCGNFREQDLNYHILRGGFTALVYAAVDNTMHLVLMYYGAIILMTT